MGKVLVEMGNEPRLRMKSDRYIRNGYMALVVSVANKLIKKYKTQDANTNEDNVVIEYLDECGEEWRAFVDDELKKSNENNNKVLGG